MQYSIEIIGFLKIILSMESSAINRVYLTGKSRPLLEAKGEFGFINSEEYNK